MKTTQAWGWLTAGVLALGLNGSYHDGGMQWAHRLAARVTYRASAVLALASGRADQFLAEARLLTAGDEVASPRRASLAQDRHCPMATATAQLPTEMAQSEAEVGPFEAMSAREESRLVRLEANRARMETQIAARVAHFRVAKVDFNSAAFNPAKVQACGRVRVNIPRIPKIKIPAPAIPTIHIEAPNAGPV